MMEPVDITALDYLSAWSLLLTFMIFPDNNEKRKQFRKWIAYKIKNYDLLEDIQKHLPMQIFDPFGTRKAASSGCLAGDVFLVYLEMANAGEKKFTLMHAFKVVSKMVDRNFDGKENSVRAGWETVRDNFHRFRDVAHLWGAFLMHFRGSESFNTSEDDYDKLAYDKAAFTNKIYKRQRVIFEIYGYIALSLMERDKCHIICDNCKPIDIVKFPAIAQSLQEFSAQFIRPRRPQKDRTILLDTALKINGISSVPIIFPIIPDRYINTCQEYL